MPDFECFSVFFCVYLRKYLIFNKKKSCVFIENNLEKCCTIQNKVLSLYQQKEIKVLTIKTYNYDY